MTIMVSPRSATDPLLFLSEEVVIRRNVEDTIIVIIFVTRSCIYILKHDDVL